MIFFHAFIGTLLIVLELGIFLEGLTWVALDTLHASSQVMLSGELIMLIPVAWVFVMIFKNGVAMEREMAELEK